MIDGVTCRVINAHVIYSISNTNQIHKKSLVDRSSNGGVAGDDVRVIFYHPDRKVDALGIDNHTVNSIPVATAGGVVETTVGPIITFLHQYAYVGRGNSSHSSIQMEHFKSAVDEKTSKLEANSISSRMIIMCYH